MHSQQTASAISRDIFARMVMLSLLVSVYISWPAWSGTSDFPSVPMLQVGQQLPGILQACILGLYLLFLTISLLRPRPGPILGVLILSAALVVIDINLLQPWFYQGVLLLAVCGLLYRSPAEALQLTRVVMALTYLWSGLNKFNADYFSDVAPWLIDPIVQKLPELREPLAVLLSFSPLMEAGLGLLLLWPTVSKFAAFAVIGMHSFILLSIGPWGHNWNVVVWPWNIFSMLILAHLFIRATLHWQLPERRFSRVAYLMVLFLMIFPPLLSFTGRSDRALSFALYSGNAPQLFVEYPSALVANVPAGLRAVSVSIASDRMRAGMIEWSVHSGAIPPYPEERVLWAEALALCQSVPSSEIVFELKVPPRFGVASSQRYKFGC